MSGLLSDSVIRGEIEALKIDIDSYIERVLAKAEDQSRIAAPKIIRQLENVFEEKSSGPYYQAILGLVFLEERLVELVLWPKIDLKI